MFNSVVVNILNSFYILPSRNFFYENRIPLSKGIVQRLIWYHLAENTGAKHSETFIISNIVSVDWNRMSYGVLFDFYIDIVSLIPDLCSWVNVTWRYTCSHIEISGEYSRFSS